MRNFIGILVLIIVVFVGGRLLYYGFSTYEPPDRPVPEVKFSEAAMSARLDAEDNPTISQGVVVIDYAHDNALFIEELNILLTKIVARGFTYEIATSAEASNDNDKSDGLVDKLRYAKTLVLPLPREDYTAEEVAAIEHFVDKGGRILMIGDPTRTVVVDALNSIGGSFDIIYVNDYLYSLKNNDNNYRNVIYTNFADSPVTNNLTDDDKIIFYAGNSINAPGHEIILGDETTHSSISEGGRTMAAAALTGNDQVLALGDLTFFTEPYSAAEKNGTFINNIADFLTGGQREFELKDFPFFFNTSIDIVYDNPLVFNSQFDDSVKLKEFLEGLEHKVTFTDEIGDENDAIFVGRFDKTDAVEEYLAEANIVILGPDDQAEKEELLAEEDSKAGKVSLISDTPPGIEDRFVDGRIQIEGIGDLERGGTTLFSLHKEDERNVLIILSDNPETNADAFEILFDNELQNCTARSNLAVCQTQKPGGDLPPSLRSTRIDNILIVSDDNGRKREDVQTSAAEYQEALSDFYRLDLWVTSEKESPDLDQLLEYDVVIWTTGDYWDDSIDGEDATLLTKYIELGGNLIMSGASIGFDWDHTEFLENVAHADYLDFAEQSDLELVLPDHPIAAEFAEGAVISFTNTPSGEVLEPDVVRHTPDSRVIFQRGPDSKQAGAASVIAYEDERVKVAYFAFPVYLLPDEARIQLINNTIDWFTKKPLELPDEKDYQPFESEGRAEDQEEQSTEEGANGTGEEDTGSGDEGNGENSGDQENGQGEDNTN